MSLLDALDPDQRQVAEHLRGPLCVLAGAGTGKTRAITYRIAHGVRTGVYQPTSVLAVTFTARAAGEMRSRLRELGVVGVQARTFHAAALRQLGYFWPKVVGGPLPKVEEKTLGLVAEAAGRLGIETDRALLFDLNAEIKWAKVQMIAPDDYPQRATAAGRAGIADVDPTTIASLMNAYEDAKSERGVIDFEDILLILVGLLVEKPEIAEEVRRQYRYFVVDEYQDVSPLQQRLLELWLGERDDLCVVGDVSQTIYSFAGASPGFLTGFSRTFPGAAKIQLVRDYRSTPQVVDIANRLLRTKTGRLPEGAVYLQAQRPSSVPVHFTGYDDDAAEAEAIARAITELNDTGVALSEIAILYRTNAQSQDFETALATAGIGYQIRGGERFFARADIRRALVMLRGAMNTSEEADMPRAVRAILSNLGWSNAAPEQAGAMRERWDALNALVVLADDMHATRGASLADFVEELHDRAANQHAPAVEGVTLASIHSSKGLEWDAVFLAGLSEGLMPISMANTPEAIEEEKRLLYVGVTRAREHLRLSYSSSRTGGRSSRNVSRFLTGIWPEGEKSASKTSRRKKAAIDPLAELDDDAQALFELLRAWRAETAKEISKPAFTILHDATLIAIAQAQPRTLRQLALLRGIGATKLDRYGGEILALIADN